jgi:hypothetical protein
VKASRNLLVAAIVASIASVALLLQAGCGSSSADANTNNNQSGSDQMAMVNLSVSDPPTCRGSSNGPFLHVYVTITDVQINASSTAGDNDAGWIDLTPTLKQAPKQVDLLATASNQCFLANLASTALPAGTYQQIRIILADNSAPPASNRCNTRPASANCVVLAADGNPYELNLSSESKTGIKIPPGQIAGGQFTIAQGQNKDLNIDFDACASIITQGNGKFRLKPVLHAGEVSLNSSAISGKLVDAATGQVIPGEQAIVALEQPTGGVDRVIMQTTPDATGNFAFCPVPLGTYDIVAVAVSGSGVSYAATITTSVAPGDALGNVPMNAVTGPNTGQGSIIGLVTTAAADGPTSADIVVSALQTVSNVQFTIPAASLSTTVVLTTVPAASCPSGTDCVNYTLQLPGVNPTVGIFDPNGTNYAIGAVGPAQYVVQGYAFVPGSAGLADCSPTVLNTSELTVTPGNTTNAPALNFTGCQ